MLTGQQCCHGNALVVALFHTPEVVENGLVCCISHCLLLPDHLEDGSTDGSLQQRGLEHSRANSKSTLAGEG